MNKDLKAAIFRYCDYRERCHTEVKNKLTELGATQEEAESLIVELIEENLLNEERYARSFARGRFILKKWGRKKIIQELKLNKVSDYCIKKAMTEIDEDAYFEVISKLIDRKLAELGKENEYAKKAKVIRYLLQKGYEMDLIQDGLTKHINISE